MVDIIVKPPKIETPHIDAIHGHTRIELKDVRTGKRERVESDNIVTDGIQYYLNLRDYFYSSTSNLFGGIFLFDKQIPETAHYMPAGTKMIGNGCYKVSNSSEVTELGSYNQTESVETKNSFVQVYDYTTAQANGEINSVCLTTKMGGFMGYGNSTSKKHLSVDSSGSKYELKTKQFAQSTDKDGNTSGEASYDELKDLSEVEADGIYYVYANNYSNDDSFLEQTVCFSEKESCLFIGYLQNSTKEFFILKKGLPVLKVLNFNYFKENFYGTEIYKKIKIDELDSNKTYAYRLNCDGTKAVIWEITKWSNNQTLNFIVYDIENNTYAVHPVQNTRASYFSDSADLSSGDMGTLSITSSGNLVTSNLSTDNCLLWEIDFNSNTTIPKIRASDVPYFTDLYKLLFNGSTPDRDFRLIPEFSSGLFFSTYYFMVDVLNKTIFPINGEFNDYRIGYYNPILLTTSYSNSRYKYIKSLLNFNPLRLMTINNLPSTITKTAAQTMKVTYTLTME